MPLFNSFFKVVRIQHLIHSPQSQLPASVLGLAQSEGSMEKEHGIKKLHQIYHKNTSDNTQRRTRIREALIITFFKLQYSCVEKKTVY